MNPWPANLRIAKTAVDWSVWIKPYIAKTMYYFSKNIRKSKMRCSKIEITMTDKYRIIKKRGGKK